jgi:hypothetical protein
LGITNEEAGWQRGIENPRKQRKVAEFQAHPNLPQKRKHRGFSKMAARGRKQKATLL